MIETIRHCRLMVKYAYQRASRGWDDTWIWDMNDSLIPVLIQVLSHKKHCLIHPTYVPGTEDYEYFYAVQERWNKTIDTMIWGFEAELRVANGERTVALTEQADEAWRLLVVLRRTLWAC